MNINQIDSSMDVESLEDEELAMAHMALHAYYKEFRIGRSKEGWDLESVVQKHNEVRDEMDSRDDLEHEYVSALDDEAVDSVEQLTIQMGQKEDVAKEWVQGVIDSEDVNQYIRDNPPESNWYTKAVEFLQNTDSTLDLSEHVSFASQPHGALDESVQEWIQEASGGETGAVGYYLNDETETGTLLLKADETFSVYVDTTEVLQTDSQSEALETYQYASRIIRDGARSQFAVKDIRQEDNWTVIEPPEEFEISQDEAPTTLEDFDVGEDVEYSELDEDTRTEITQRFVASSSGVPAESWEDLWGAYRTSTGDISQSAVSQLRSDNASGDVPTPSNIRDNIESALSQVDTEEMEQGEVVESDVDDGDGRWYVWDQDEAERWLQAKGLEYGEPTTEGDFTSYSINDPDEYEELWQEWWGPRYRPYTFIQELDEKPVFLTLGAEEEYAEQVSLISVKFQTQKPAEYNDLVQQMSTLESDLDFYWYQWAAPEVETWLHERDFSSMEQSRDGEWLRVTLQSADQYETLHKGWEGRRSQPDDISQLAGGDKPRRIIYGEDSEGNTEPQAIEFRVDSPFGMD